MACCALVGLSGCSESEPPTTESVVTQTSSPDEGLTVVADGTDRASSLHMSRALFDKAPVAVVAPTADVRAQGIAARVAVGLGVPLLVGPSSRDGDTAADTEGLSAELGRLRTTTVVAVGHVGRLPGDGTPDESRRSPDVVRIAATAGAVRAELGLRLLAASAGGAARAADIASLRPGPPSGSALQHPRPTAGPSVPAIRRDAVVTGTVALAIDAPEQLAPIATARAAGVPVQLLPHATTNPQSSGAVIDGLHASGARKAIAVGAAFAAEPALDWKVRAALAGAQLPGGGQLVFASRQYIALYGVPGAAVLGVLGEQDARAAVDRAKSMASSYGRMTAKTAVPMFEMMATVASGSAGRDGNYSNELSLESLRPWVDEATAAGLYVVIDLQPGRSDFLTQAKLYEPLLELPNVGLALDPEWRLGPDQVPLRQIGSVGSAEVNSVISWLADLTSRRALPQKMLVLHQFRPSMLQDREAIDVSRPELAIAIHADGQGAQPDKQATWRALREDAPPGVAWGWKNFYDEDAPMLTPEQTVTTVSPVPDLITYQ